METRAALITWIAREEATIIDSINIEENTLTVNINIEENELIVNINITSKKECDFHWRQSLLIKHLDLRRHFLLRKKGGHMMFFKLNNAAVNINALSLFVRRILSLIRMIKET